MNIKPLPTDGHPTSTSRIQAETEAVLLEHIPPADAAANLNKPSHLRFLTHNLTKGFPLRYMSQDASQPWLMFWTTQSFAALQVAFDAQIRQRYSLIIDFY